MFISLAVIGVQLAFAQNFVVKGQVTSSEGKEPLIGVSILQDGSSNGVITDIDGNYTIEIKGASKAVLKFSYIGMQSQLQVVTADTKVLNVMLKSDSQLMDEVVVVAYGVRKKGTIAGSVSTVKAEKMENVPAAGFDQALQGQTPGLSVMSSSGEPSKAATFQIRGTNSINSGTSPLFILDGVPITSSDFNTISPSDIESISVLKDASSTSIYGARAANGVIVITTKRGRSLDKAKVSFRTQLGFSQLARTKWNLMDTSERIQYEKEIGLDTGKDYDKLSRTNVNWLDEVFNKTAPLQNYELSINGATDKTNYFISGGFYDQDGIASGSTFRRYNMRANVETKATSWLRLGTNSMLTYEEIEQAVDGEYALYAPITASRFMLPYWNPYREDGSLASVNDGSWTGTTENPLEWMENNPLKNKKYKVLSTLYAEVTPIEGLILRSQFGVDYTHITAFMQSFPSYKPNNLQGSAGRQSSSYLNLTITNTANYRFTLKDVHSFNFMLGQEGINYRSEGFQVTSAGQNSDMLTNVSSGTRATRWADMTDAYAFVSFFGRGEYNYDDRYYADFSVRTDGSSRFGTEGRWATFWSVGLMWNFQKESFMKKYEDWLTNAQLTFSTGTSGNSAIPNYDHLALVRGGLDYAGEAGIAPYQRGNEKMGWESLWTTNVGLHLGFYNRFNLDLEFYNKLTTNILMSVPVSYADGGYPERWDNVGSMINRGVELNLNADVIRTKNFTWNVSANVSYNKNKIKELYNGADEFTISTTGVKLVKGHSVGEFYLNRYAGVNPANGDQLWYTKNGELTTKYSDADKVLTGRNFNAPWQGGFGTNFMWKGWSLAAQFSWTADRWIFNNDRYFEESNGLYSAYNQSKRLLYDRWKKPGDLTEIPRHGLAPEMDDRFLEDASFLRLKNLMLSYTFPKPWMMKTKFIENLRVYGQAQNLFTFTKFSGLDPETNSNLYKAQYPTTRQFSFGLEVTF